jgi:hypothetical protein
MSSRRLSSSVSIALKHNSISFLRFRTDVVQDVHPGVLFYGEDQPLAFLHVERTSVFYFDPGH